VDNELHRIFFIGIKVRRLDQEAFDFVVVGAGEPEGLEWRLLDLGKNRVVHASHCLWILKAVQQGILCADPRLAIDSRILSSASSVDCSRSLETHLCEKNL